MILLPRNRTKTRRYSNKKKTKKKTKKKEKKMKKKKKKIYVLFCFVCLATLGVPEVA